MGAGFQGIGCMTGGCEPICQGCIDRAQKLRPLRVDASQTGVAIKIFKLKPV